MDATYSLIDDDDREQFYAAIDIESDALRNDTSTTDLLHHVRTFYPRPHGVLMRLPDRTLGGVLLFDPDKHMIEFAYMFAAGRGRDFFFNAMRYVRDRCGINDLHLPPDDFAIGVLNRYLKPTHARVFGQL